MGSFIIKNENPKIQCEEQVEVYYDSYGYIYKIEIYSTLLEKDVPVDLKTFALQNPVLFQKLQTKAGSENYSDQENKEPNPAA